MPRKRNFSISNKKIKAEICSFEQATDGSIYITFPHFDKSKWILSNENNSELIYYDSPGKGKLSIHGSGITHVKSFLNGSQTKFRIVGNQLLSQNKKTAGVRHLATIFPSKPPLRSLTNDVVGLGEIEPMVFVFYAIPTGTDLEFQSSFNLDEYQIVPPMLGAGSEVLKTHQIFWFSYKTKHMENWPLATHVYIADGFSCPLFIGTNSTSMRVEVRMPEYIIHNNTIRIHV